MQAQFLNRTGDSGGGSYTISILDTVMWTYYSAMNVETSQLLCEHEMMKVSLF